MSWDSDHGLSYRASQVCLGIFFDFLKYECRNLLRREALAIKCDFVISTHLSLDFIYGSLRIGGCLPFCWLTHQQLTIGRESHNRGEHLARHGGPSALGMTTGLPASITAAAELVVP